MCKCEVEKLTNIVQVIYTCISANANGPRNAASRKINHIALQAECITRQQASVDSENSLVQRPTAVGYMHGEAQTPLGRFVVYILYK